MWSVRVELVGTDGRTTLINEYSSEAAEIARQYALDVFELLAESNHELDFGMPSKDRVERLRALIREFAAMIVLMHGGEPCNSIVFYSY